MPLAFQRQSQDYRYMLFAKEIDNRQKFAVLMQGVCTLEECEAWLNAYPLWAFPDPDEIPRNKDYFQHENQVKTHVIGVTSVSCLRGVTGMPAWWYRFEQEFGQFRFTDPYSFHVWRHFFYLAASVFVPVHHVT